MDGVRESDETCVLSWDDLLDLCSRIHTTRTRPAWPGEDAPMREDSQMIDVWIDGVKAQVVPTRMHEPGFYWRYVNADGPRHSEEQLALLRRMTEQGRVVRYA